MSPSRHRAKALPLRARVGKIALPLTLATTATGLVVSVGLATTGGVDELTKVAADAANAAALKIDVSDAPDRTRTVSRAAKRVALEPRAIAKKYATADLNIWTRPSEKSKNVGLVKSGTRVALTGQVVHGWAEVLLKGQVRYVNAD